MIIRAEEQHINSLKAIIYDKYGIDIPEEKKQQIVLPCTLSEVCVIGVQAEIDNAKLYKEDLLPSVSDYEDISWLGKYSDNTIDAFGDAYEFLMTMYASNTGKSGGEFYTLLVTLRHYEIINLCKKQLFHQMKTRDSKQLRD